MLRTRLRSRETGNDTKHIHTAKRNELQPPPPQRFNEYITIAPSQAGITRDVGSVTFA